MVEEILSGDRNAFKQLINKYERLVKHIVFPILKNQDDRADVCQDVFLKIYTKLNSFEFRARLSTWIGNITYNTCVNYLQKKKNLLIDDYLTSEESADSKMNIFIAKNDLTPADILIKKEEIVSLTGAINKLTPVQKTVILLFHQDDLSLEEISNIMELPSNTIKSHLYRARMKLKEILINQ
ncbi:MAG: RNA polymerase sigma factor [Ignavibacteriales bacterium]|nr:RNA polymerase sigma factor [Ignavibacteriales bacterium]